MAAPAEQRGARWWRAAIKPHAYLGETLLLVAALYVVNVGHLPARPGFLGVEPNPYWAVILLMAARYGFRASLFAALCCSAAYFAAVVPRTDLVAARDLLSWELVKTPFLFLSVSVLLGLLVQRSKDRIASLEEAQAKLAADNRGLADERQELSEANLELANRVMGATDTLPLLYKYAKKLNSLDRDEVLVSLTELVQEVVKAQQVSVYRVEGERLLLHSRNGARAEGDRLELDARTFQEVVRDRRVVSLHDLLDRGLPRADLFLCGPLGPSGREASAVLAVERLQFLRFNPASVRLFKVIIDWAASSLGSAGGEQRPAPALQPVPVAAPALPPAPVGRPVPVAAPLSPKRPAAPAPSPAPAKPEVVPPGRPIAAPAGALGNVLARAGEDLFDDADAPALRVEDSVELPAGGAGQPAQLQRLLTSQIDLARSQGNQSLERLLAEIDGYLSKEE